MILQAFLPLVHASVASAEAARPPRAGPVLLVGQTAASPWGSADNLPEGHYVEDDTTDTGDYGSMQPSIDLRLGLDYLPSRWFSLSTYLGVSRWQTELFETIGRGHSYTFDALVVPTLRIQLSRGHPGFALFTGVGAGPSVSRVADDSAHAQVEEHTRARPGFSVVVTHGADFQIRSRFGLRVQVEGKWMAVRYVLERRGPDGSLGSTRFNDMLVRPLFSMGVWFRL
jgi:hypothetical protein